MPIASLLTPIDLERLEKALTISARTDELTVLRSANPYRGHRPAARAVSRFNFAIDTLRLCTESMPVGNGAFVLHGVENALDIRRVAGRYFSSLIPAGKDPF